VNLVYEPPSCQTAGFPLSTPRLPIYGTHNFAAIHPLSEQKRGFSEHLFRKALAFLFGQSANFFFALSRFIEHAMLTPVSKVNHQTD